MELEACLDIVECCEDMGCDGIDVGQVNRFLLVIVWLICINVLGYLEV
jgi:hypothetical protein